MPWFAPCSPAPLARRLGFLWPKSAPARVEPARGAQQAKSEDPGSEKNSTPASTTQLPIGQVVLFSSGVGYFQREGSVEGNARVDLSFPVQDINDLLKSMVLRDLDGGHISTVSYDSNAPVERTLKSFAINLTGNPSFGPSSTRPAARRSRSSCSRPTRRSRAR